MLIDSDVLVWLTRGHLKAAQRLQEIPEWKISVVTYIELAQGCRDKAELARLKKGLAAHQVEVIQITPPISQQAATLVDQFGLSHHMRLPDALIAATALEHRLPLITANVKHFGAVSGLTVEVFVP
jgi:predicted nucleic acid-binding protein